MQYYHPPETATATGVCLFGFNMINSSSLRKKKKTNDHNTCREKAQIQGLASPPPNIDIFAVLVLYSWEAEIHYNRSHTPLFKGKMEENTMKKSQGLR